MSIISQARTRGNILVPRRSKLQIKLKKTNFKFSSGKIHENPIPVKLKFCAFNFHSWLPITKKIYYCFCWKGQFSFPFGTASDIAFISRSIREQIDKPLLLITFAKTNPINAFCNDILHTSDLTRTVSFDEKHCFFFLVNITLRIMI